MTYNIHPIFVHFPIALLLIYSVIKLVPLRKWFPRVAWRDIERVLLVVGVLSAFVASSTGEIAEHLVRADRQLVEAHAFFASASTWLYGLLLVGEVLAYVTPEIIPKLGMQKVTTFFLGIQKILTNHVIVAVLALLGLIAIAVTGLLGGVLVYGVSADPVAPLVLRLLGI